ncbi:MAG: cupin domain-containing protein [Streptosporangiaceae bacterium]
MTAAIIRAAEAEPELTEDGATVRVLAATGPAGGPETGRLIRRLVDVPPGAQWRGQAGPAGELWFIIAGHGRLDAGGHAAVTVGQGQGLRLPAGSRYRLRPDGGAAMQVDAVSLPASTLGSRAQLSAQGSEAVTMGRIRLPAQLPEPDADEPAGLLVNRLDDCAPEMTGDRRFRVLFGPGRGCAAATQFVGEIPPGRARDHSHPYDEVVLVLQGSGLLHLGPDVHDLGPGSCVHLPPGQRHCLENTGQATLVVLGVFHPGGSPAAKAGPAPA